MKKASSKGKKTVTQTTSKKRSKLEVRISLNLKGLLV